MTLGLWALPPIWLAHLFVLVVGFLFCPVWAEEPQTKRLIYYGWSVPDTLSVRDRWHEMEAMPFDGVGIVVAVDRQAWLRGVKATRNQLGWQVMGRRPFDIEQFRSAIRDLKAAKWRTFTENLLPIALSASQSANGLNWFDGARWDIVVNNFGVAARIAGQGGLRGLILDPEHYGYSLFSYTRQRQYADRSFDEFTEAAHQRGRQVMAAIADSLPDALILSLYGYTLPLRELDRRISLRQAEYGLLPAFYDGLLEAMPDGAHFVDGYEFAYPFKERRRFVDGYQRIHREAVRLSAVPTRYREKVRAGFGLWLDYHRQEDYFTPEEFRRAVGHALEVSDGTVWVYSEGLRFFFPRTVGPSYIEALAEARAINRGSKRSE